MVKKRFQKRKFPANSEIRICPIAKMWQKSQTSRDRLMAFSETLTSSLSLAPIRQGRATLSSFPLISLHSGPLKSMKNEETAYTLLIPRTLSSLWPAREHEKRGDLTNSLHSAHSLVTLTSSAHSKMRMPRPPLTALNRSCHALFNPSPLFSPCSTFLCTFAEKASASVFQRFC